MRSKPFRLITGAELESLTPDQRKILDAAIKSETLVVVNEKFVPKEDVQSTEYMLSLSPQEIQRKFVSRMALSKDVDGLTKLLKAEQGKKEPRQQVVGMLTFALDRIYEMNPEERFYRAIEAAEEVIEGVVVEKPVEATAKKTHKRMSKLAATPSIISEENK